MSAWIPNLSWVTPDLAVGGAFPTGAAGRLTREHGVGAVVDLRAEACDDPEELAGCGLRFLHLPTGDMLGVDLPMLEIGVRFAKEARGNGLKLLVHCEHGIGRSATLALCVLVDWGLAPLEALRAAKDARAVVSPSEAQYLAWMAWLSRHAPNARAPSYHEFGVIAYRHLTPAG